MRLQVRDLVATVLVVAIAIPYVDLLVGGDLTLVEDVRGMAGTGIVAGAAAFLVLARHDAFDRVGRSEAALALLSLVLGFVTYQLNDTNAAPSLLAVFMVSLLLVWAVKVAHHAGLHPLGRGSRGAS